MDITTLGTCVAIVAICYVIGLGCKAAQKIPDEWIPVIMAVCGAGNEHHAGLPGDGLYQCCGGGHGVRAGGHRSKPGIQAGKESVILWADVAEVVG